MAVALIGSRDGIVDLVSLDQVGEVEGGEIKRHGTFGGTSVNKCIYIMMKAGFKSGRERGMDRDDDGCVGEEKGLSEQG